MKFGTTRTSRNNGDNHAMLFSAEPNTRTSSTDEVKRKTMWLYQNLLKTELSEYDLTNREVEVAEALLGGMPTKYIANLMKLSESTVKYHITNILHKTKTCSRGDFVMMMRAKLGAAA